MSDIFTFESLDNKELKIFDIKSPLGWESVGISFLAFLTSVPKKIN